LFYLRNEEIPLLFSLSEDSPSCGNSGLVRMVGMRVRFDALLVKELLLEAVPLPLLEGVFELLTLGW